MSTHKSIENQNRVAFKRSNLDSAVANDNYSWNAKQFYVDKLPNCQTHNLILIWGKAVIIEIICIFNAAFRSFSSNRSFKSLVITRSLFYILMYIVLTWFWCWHNRFFLRRPLVDIPESTMVYNNYVIYADGHSPWLL